MSETYQEIYNQWKQDPEGFWANAAEDIDWYKKWDKVLDDSEKPVYRWFQGGEVNTCYNALDRHVALDGEVQGEAALDLGVEARAGGRRERVRVGAPVRVDVELLVVLDAHALSGVGGDREDPHLERLEVDLLE